MSSVCLLPGCVPGLGAALRLCHLERRPSSRRQCRVAEFPGLASWTPWFRRRRRRLCKCLLAEVGRAVPWKGSVTNTVSPVCFTTNSPEERLLRSRRVQRGSSNNSFKTGSDSSHTRMRTEAPGLGFSVSPWCVSTEPAAQAGGQGSCVRSAQHCPLSAWKVARSEFWLLVT